MESTPEFQVHSITPADLPSMISIYISAFSLEYVNSYAMPPATCTPARKTRWLHDRFSGFFSKPELHMYKVVESGTGKTVAWSRWCFPYTLTAEEREERRREKEQEERDVLEGRRTEYPEGANVEVCKALFGGLRVMREKYMDPSQHYFVHLVATDPDYQRRGLATMLLRHGLALADADNMRTYIEATASGHPVYLKLGWKDVDRLDIDLKKWGIEEPGYHWAMIREPVGKLENAKEKEMKN